MQPFLGLFLLSALLTTGAALECETCIGVGQHCSGNWQTCGAGQDTCVTLVTKATVEGITGYSVVKGCENKAICNENKNYDVMPGTTVVTRVECSKAAIPSGSLLLSLLGLLLMKMLL